MGIYFSMAIFIKQINPLESAVLAVMPSLVLVIYTQVVSYNRNKQLSLLKIRFFRDISLKISTGMSLLDAIESICHNSNNFLYKKIRHHVTFRQHFNKSEIDKSCFEVIDFIKNALDSPVNIREKLNAYEEKLFIEHDFRRRSGQALLGVRIQAAIMCLLYFFAFIYTLSFYDFEKNKILILVSLILFVFGLIWLTKIGGKIRWKV